MPPALAYLNGDWIDGAALYLPLDDLGVVQGAAVVERLRTFAHRPFQLGAHMTRLRRSLDIVGWDAARLIPAVEQAIDEFRKPVEGVGERRAVRHVALAEARVVRGDRAVAVRERRHEIAEHVR